LRCFSELENIIYHVKPIDLSEVKFYP
jgi:hypothetical protein